MLFYIILLLVLLIIPLLGFRGYYLRSKTRERLNFGMKVNEEAAEINLAAGDYGLEGGARFIYYLSESLSTKQGTFFIMFVGGLIGFIIANSGNKNFENVPVVVLFSAFMLFLIAKMLLNAHKRKRMSLIKAELPNALQMTAAIMESGLGFEAAINHVIKESDTKHPLYFDLAVMAEAMQRGRRRNEALKLWASRTQEQTVSDVAAAMIQADQTGSSLGSVLKHHADTLLRENEAAMMRRAERLPIKMLLPMVGFILFPVLVIAAGPSVLRIFQIFEEMMSRA